MIYRYFKIGLLLTGLFASGAAAEPTGELLKDSKGPALELRSHSRVSLVPLVEDRVEFLEETAPVAEPEPTRALPPIMVKAKVKTYEKVVIGKRRVSMASRGAAPAEAVDEYIYKTVPKVEYKQIDISPIIEKHAASHGLDPWLVRAVIEVESAFRPTAVSPVGAGGLMQLMPGTASYLGCRDRFDVEQNIAAGTKYLKMMHDRFKSQDLMLAAYNAGPGNVERYGGIPPFAETQRYVVKVKKALQNAKAADLKAQ